MEDERKESKEEETDERVIYEKPRSQNAFESKSNTQNEPSNERKIMAKTCLFA